ncbi:MAG TPA: hypothetical protein VIX59_02170 [Candidatus Binataceae bacterium]
MLADIYKWTLADVCGRFIEGFDAADLKDAAARGTGCEADSSSVH